MATQTDMTIRIKYSLVERAAILLLHAFAHIAGPFITDEQADRFCDKWATRYVDWVFGKRFPRAT